MSGTQTLSGKDQLRAFRRTATQIPVTLLLGEERRGNYHHAAVLQTSFLGMKVRTKLALKRGQMVNVVRLTGPYMAVPASVVWVGATLPDHQKHIGLKFMDPLHARIDAS